MSATPKYTWSKTTSSILKPHQDGRPLRGWTVGGRLFRMPGMDLKSLRKHYSLIPLFFCVGAGVCGATLYLIRLATCCPDVTWIQQEKQPWERLPPTYQYKFYSPNIDYSKLKTPPERPDI